MILNHSFLFACSTAPLSLHPNQLDWLFHFFHISSNLTIISLSSSCNNVFCLICSSSKENSKIKIGLRDCSAHTYLHSVFLSLLRPLQSSASSALQFLPRPYLLLQFQHDLILVFGQSHQIYGRFYRNFCPITLIRAFMKSKLEANIR